jgi:hypothetical protein
MGMSDCKPCSSPWAGEPVSDKVDLNVRRRQAVTDREESQWKTEEQAEVLDCESLKRYQTVAAKLNFLSLDRMDIQYAVKELMRRMADPTELDEQRLKRVCRYLMGQPRMIQTFPFGPLAADLLLHVDSNFAGCQRTRKSTSGGVVSWGGGVLKTWAKTQSTIALSSGEAELAAVIKGAAEGLGMQAVLRDFGRSVGIQMLSDATAAIGMVAREGLGKVRHLAVADLWIQQRVRRGDLTVGKVNGKDNPADICTKGVPEAEIQKHMKSVLIFAAKGRHQLAPKLT